MKKQHRRTQSSIEPAPMQKDLPRSSESHKILTLLKQPKDIEKQVIVENIHTIERPPQALGLQLNFGRNKTPKHTNIKKYIPS